MEISAKKQRAYNLEEVNNHQEIDDCWIVICDRVYNVTTFLRSHPGSMEILMEHAGSDATIAFRNSGHSDYALRLLTQYEIGELVDEQKLFTNVST